MDKAWKPMDQLAHQFQVAAKRDEEEEKKFTGGKEIHLPTDNLPGMTEEQKVEKFLDDLGKDADKNKKDDSTDSPQVLSDLEHVKEAQREMARDEKEEKKLELKQPKKLRELGR